MAVVPQKRIHFDLSVLSAEENTRVSSSSAFSGRFTVLRYFLFIKSGIYTFVLYTTYIFLAFSVCCTVRWSNFWLFSHLSKFSKWRTGKLNALFFPNCGLREPLHVILLLVGLSLLTFTSFSTFWFTSTAIFYRIVVFVLWPTFNSVFKGARVALIF